MTTLDQLIKDWLDSDPCDFMAPADAAIRAVLDLHQPRGGYRQPCAWYGDVNECTSCGGYELVAGHGERGHRTSWPCSTAQAIATSLGITQETPNAK